MASPFGWPTAEFPVPLDNLIAYVRALHPDGAPAVPRSPGSRRVPGTSSPPGSPPSGPAAARRPARSLGYRTCSS